MSASTEAGTKRVTVNCPACRAVNADADVNTLCRDRGEPVFMNSSWVNRTPGGPPAAPAMFASVAWGACFIFFRIRNDSKAYGA